METPIPHEKILREARHRRPLQRPQLHRSKIFSSRQPTSMKTTQITLTALLASCASTKMEPRTDALLTAIDVRGGNPMPPPPAGSIDIDIY